MSNKKEKVEFVRSNEFEAVEDELGSALELLEQANARISELLNSESRGGIDVSAVGELETAETVPAPEPAAQEAPATGSVPRIRRAKAKAEAAS